MATTDGETDTGDKKKKKKKKSEVDDKIGQLTDKLLDHATQIMKDDEEKGPKH